MAAINEWELECTIFARYQALLPDFYSQGYKLSRQVMISGISRRMDLVLERDDHAWIIELKKGSPPLQATTRQILDYEKCWKAAFPSKPVSLMVISNSVDDAKAMAFQTKGISHRTIPAKKVLEALKQELTLNCSASARSCMSTTQGRFVFYSLTQS